MINLIPARIIILLDYRKIFNCNVNFWLADYHLGLMPHKTKHQWQVSKLPRKIGHYASQEQVITEETITIEIETVKNLRFYWSILYHVI